jgi:beta-lactamase regulating signal transducer with metallopeptidase domain
MHPISLTFAELFSSSSLLLIDSAIKVTVLLVLATIATCILRRDSAATRHFVWLLTVVAMLLVPALSALLPQWRVLPEWARFSSKAEVSVTSQMDSPAIDRTVNQVTEPFQHEEPILADRPVISTPQLTAQTAESTFTSATPKATSESSSWSLNQVLRFAWLLGFSVLILRLIAARWMLWKLEQQATTVCLAGQNSKPAIDPLTTHSLATTWEGRATAAVDSSTLIDAFAAAKIQLGMRHSVALLIHPKKTIPLVWGVLRSRLMLPAAARQWDVAQLQSVLLHELAHIKRRDTLAQLLTQLACALHWFNPLAWFAAWSMGVERERACDDLVLASGVRPSVYAGHLLHIVTELSTARWTQSCGLAMARSSSLEGRVVAVLNKNLNRRSVSVILAAVALVTTLGIAIPMAMLRAADHQVAATDQPAEKPQPQAAAVTDAKPQSGEKLKPGTTDFLQWSEAHNGLRAALVIRHSADKPKPGDKPDLYLAVQNVTEQPIRFNDTIKAPQLRYLKFYSNRVIQAGIATDAPSLTDVTLQPREVVYVLFFGAEPRGKDGGTTGSLLAEGALKDTHESFAAELKIEQAPAGAWTGKLVIGQTTGAIAAGQPQPKDKDAQALFNVWQHHMRSNGNFPGGLVGRLGEKVREFIELNTGDAGGDAYAKKMAPLVPRLNATRDWTAAEIVALLDDIAAVTSIPLATTLEETQTRTFQSGTPLPPELASAPWGKAEPNGLRMAWLLEPRAAAYRLNTPLKSRILIHNEGENSIIIRTRTFHQSSQHKAHNALGANIKVSSTFWTTLGRRVAYRLAPNEFVELTGAGIGVGANRDSEDWQNTRVGSWIEAQAGDDITFQPDAVQTTDESETPSPDKGPDWWLNFIKATLTQDLPVPADAEERRRLVYRAGMELFGTPLTTEDIMSFVNDREPNSLDNLAKRLANRPSVSTFKGPLTSGPTKFRVLPIDPDADKKPRVANSPGRYTLGDQIRLIVTRRPVGPRIVNEGTIQFFSTDPTKAPPGKPHDLKLPDNYGTWATAWLRGTTVLWIIDQGQIRSVDFTNPAAVTETPYEAGTPNFEKIPKPILEALRTALEVPASPKPAAKPPAAASPNK